MTAYISLPTPAQEIPVPLQVTSAPYTTRIDEVSTSITYIGKAIPGSATNSSVWQIQKLTSSGNDLIVQFADSGNFSQIWDSREALSYS
jgi:hypothetical protein